MKKINMAIVGLAFGGFFAEIYQNHPDVGELVLFDVDKQREENLCKKMGITRRYDTFEDLLAAPDIDAVHLVTPYTLHEEQSVAVLEAGKHCACTVPMALSVDGIKRIIDAKRRSGKNYMMMETTLYTYQYFYAENMKKKGEFGDIQFLRGCHYQDMENWPSYWIGVPPMYYGTHALSPMARMAGSRIKSVTCYGSGKMNPEYEKGYGNPFPVESALIEFENGLKGEVTRSVFATAKEYIEGFSVYGSKRSFEFMTKDDDAPTVTRLYAPAEGNRGGLTTTKSVHMPFGAENLPESIQQFATGGCNFNPLSPDKPWFEEMESAHHGSHPHLVHEFVRSIIEERQPAIDEIFGANISAAGVLAHESAMNNGKRIEIPEF